MANTYSAPIRHSSENFILLTAWEDFEEKKEITNKWGTKIQRTDSGNYFGDIKKNFIFPLN